MPNKLKTSFPHSSSAEMKRKAITELDESNDGEPLLSQAPSLDLLYSLDELGYLLQGLLGLDAPRDEAGRLLDVRLKGMWFEWEVAKRLGYVQRPKSGAFPDMRHQLIESKHHTGKSITIDFGKHHPGTKGVIAARWNQKLKFKVSDVRYLIALAPPPDFKIVTLIIKTGEQLADMFGVSITQTVKYQMGISRAWREENLGKIIYGDKIVVSQ